MSYSAGVLNELAPKAREMLNIPKEHYAGLIVGFGYPEIEYARGVQKDRSAKTHRRSEYKSDGKQRSAGYILWRDRCCIYRRMIRQLVDEGQCADSCSCAKSRKARKCQDAQETIENAEWYERTFNEQNNMQVGEAWQLVVNGQFSTLCIFIHRYSLA